MGISQSINQLRKQVSQDNNQALKNPWVLAFLGVVTVFVTVNSFFIFMAFISSPGLVVENYYDRGREYEKNALKMLAATYNTRNWETRLDMSAEIHIGNENSIRFVAVDERGLPVKASDVTLIAYRPSNADADISVTMDEIAPGMFQANVIFPLKGIWDVNIKVQKDNDKYELAHRISVMP